MLNNEVVAIIDLEDFKKYNQGGNYVDSTTLNNDEWCYDNVKKIAKFKKSSKSSNCGCIKYYFSDFNISDEVEIELDVKVISGLFKLSINDNGDLADEIKYDYDEWKTLKLKHIFNRSINKESSNTRINIGFYSDDIGEYEVRNIRIKLKKAKESIKFLKATFVKNGEIFILKNNVSNDNLTFKTLPNNAKRGYIEFNRTFNNIPTILLTQSYYNNSSYRPI